MSDTWSENARAMVGTARGEYYSKRGEGAQDISFILSKHTHTLTRVHAEKGTFKLHTYSI